MEHLKKQNMDKLIKNKMINAYKLFLKNDSYLLINGVNERSLTHKFAEYLQGEFPEYNVDCEYNKNLGNVKITSIWEEKKQELIQELQNQKVTSKRKEKIEKMLNGEISVYPDIIIHRRGTKNNFIIIEAKKSTNQDIGDNGKLLSYKKSLNYKHAIAIQFLVKEKYKEYKNISLKDLISEKQQ